MFTPPVFLEERLPVVHDLMHQARLVSLVTMGENGLEASQVPIVFDQSVGEFGTIHGHLSRGNAQWRTADTKVPALIMFSGPDAYISPSWYATKAQTEKVVPTWNYQAIHAYGTIEFFEDPDRLLDLVTRLTTKHEGARTDPWAVSDAPADFIAAQLKGIMGFTLPITRLDGKSKMSQNKSDEDRQGVIRGLNEDGTEQEAIVAQVMSDK